MFIITALAFNSLLSLLVNHVESVLQPPLVQVNLYKKNTLVYFYFLFLGRAQFVGIELYSHLKDYLETHLNQIQPVCYLI